MMRVGAYVLIDHKAWEVMEIHGSGDMLVRDPDDPLKSKWVDYYIGEVIDPHKDPGALLEALGTLGDEEDISDG